jgi:uncharacterized membrane protein YkgB
MYRIAKLLPQYSLLRRNLDYHLVLASMLIIFWFSGYQKWFAYESQFLIPLISHGPLTFWLYPLFGIRGTSWFLGMWEWLILILMIFGIRYATAAALGALGAIITFVCTFTIIPFAPGAWAAESGGFPAMGGFTPLLIKDLVLLAISVYLLKQALLRVPNPHNSNVALRALSGIAGRMGLLQSDFDYGFMRGAMVVVYLVFSYGKFFPYATKLMVLYITHAPLIFWLNPLLGVNGESRFLGIYELITATLFTVGFWNKKVGMVAALASSFAFVGTITIIPFIPNGWEPSAGGFPAMTGEVPFLIKDFAFLAVSLYLLKQDAVRVLSIREDPVMHHPSMREIR